MEGHPRLDPETNFVNDLRMLADRKVAELYASDLELYTFAEQEAAQFTRSVCSVYEADELTDPAVPILRSAFTQLFFGFTSPHNYSESLSEDVLVDEFMTQEHLLMAQDTPYITLEKIAIYLGFQAAMALLVKAGMDKAHELDGLGPDDCFAIVKARMQLINVAETIEPEQRTMNPRRE